MRLSALPLAALLLFAGCGSGRPLDAAVRLGARGVLGYRVRAGAASEVPGDQVGFVVTANGLGGYRLAWVGVDGNASVFTASIGTDGTFDPASTLPLSGRETIQATDSEVDVSSTPSSAPDGVDVVPSTDPIYVDARIDGAPARIWFTGADTSTLRATDLDPVAFTSP